MTQRDLGIGDFGAGVTELHERLLARSVDVPEEERRRAFFGPGTRAAVLEHQRREGLPPTGTADTPTAASLEEAVTEGASPPVEPRTAPAAVAEPEQPALGDLRGVLATLPTPLLSGAERSVERVLRQRGPRDPEFVPMLLEQGLTETEAVGVQRTIELADLTMGSIALTDRLQPLVSSDPDASLRSLVEVRPDEWLDLAYATGAPPASTLDEETYAQRLQSRIEDLHPRATLLNRLGASDLRVALPGTGALERFLRENADIDIMTTPMARIELRLDEADEAAAGPALEAAQRLRRARTVAATWDDAAVLLGAGLESASELAGRSTAQLRELVGDELSESRLAAIRSRARAVHDVSLALMTALPRFTQTTIAALPVAELDTAPLAEYPTLQALFGPQDACECADCRSVLSPAAYFVDLLQFVRTSQTAFATLAARRPDLLELELSCENSERTIPAIDLALDILEAAVALPLRVDLPPGTDVVAMLRAASVPPAVVAVLRRTAKDVGDDLYAVADASPLLLDGATYWIVADRWRRWRLRHFEDSLLATRRRGKGGQTTVTRLDLASLDVAGVLAELESASLADELDQQLRALVLGSPDTPGRVTRAIVTVEPGRRWTVTYSWTVRVEAGALEAETVLTLSEPESEPALRRRYSGAAMAVTVSALDKGEVAGMLKPLLGGAHDYAVETVLPGRAWTVARRSATVELRYVPQSLDVTGLTHQGNPAADDRAAEPHDRNDAAYEVLRAARHPWTLPFDLSLAEVRALLERAGVTRLELNRRMRGAATTDDVVEMLERLELAPAQAAVITDAAQEPGVWEVWGLSVVNGVASLEDRSAGKRVSGAPLEVLGRVSILLQQSGLRQSELLAALETTWVRGEDPIPGIAPPTECQPSAMRITWSSSAQLDRLHRFVRLQRALGWAPSQLDVMLTTLGSAPGAITRDLLIRLAHARRLCQELDVEPEIAAAWWSDVSTRRYRDYAAPGWPEVASVYDRAFLDPVIRNPPDDDLRLRTDRRDVRGAQAGASLIPLRTKQQVLAGVFAVQEREIAVLAETLETVGSVLPLRLKTLSELHKVVTFSRALELPIDDVLRARRLTGIDPFSGPAATVAFRDAVADVRASGFSFQELSHVLRHEDARGTPVDLSDEQATAALIALRAAAQGVRDEVLAGQGNPELSLRAGLQRLGWYPELIQEVVAGLEGGPSAPLALTQPQRATVVFPPPLRDLVRIDGGALVTSDFLPDWAWDRTHADSLYASMPAGADGRDAFERAVDELQAIVGRLRRRLQSAALPRFTASAGTPSELPALPEALAERCWWEPGSPRMPTTLVLLGWCSPADAEQLRSALGQAFDPAVTALRAASDAYAEQAPMARLLDDAEARALLRPGVSPRDRRRRVLAAVARSAGRAACADQLAQTLRVAPPAMAELAGRVRDPSAAGSAAIEALTDPGFIASDARAVPTGAAFARPFAALRRVHKAAVLAERMALSADQLRWIAAGAVTTLDLDALPVEPDGDSAALFAGWRRLLALTRLPRVAAGADALLTRYVAALTKPGRTVAQRIADARDELATGLNVDPSLVTDCAAQLGMTDLAGLRDPQRLGSLIDLVITLKRLGASVQNASALLAADPPFGESAQAADIARALLRGRYAPGQWGDVLRPVSDRLRRHQRDALVDRLASVHALAGADPLYERYLIDVLMGPCLDTTRLLHAVGAVQLFVERCLMDLEPAVPPSTINRSRWQWMRNYRVWEANRRVFLYPQNWIHHELRDDKSDAFRSLEAALGQAEPSAQTGSDAIRAFLDAFAELTQMTVVGMYADRDSGPVRLYVVGRTPNQPYSYYWRDCDNFGAAGMRWSGWERLDIDISGTHVMPFVMQGDLHVAWPVIRKSQVGSKPERWEVQLAWARRTGSGWTQKKLSRDTFSTEVLPAKDERATFAFRVDKQRVSPVGAPGTTTQSSPLPTVDEEVVVRVYSAVDTLQRLKPRGSFPFRTSGRLASLVVDCAVLFRSPDTGHYWPAPGVQVLLTLKIPYVPFPLPIPLFDTDANGRSWRWLGAKSVDENSIYLLTTYTASVTWQGKSMDQSITLMPGGEICTWYAEFVFDVPTGTKEPAVDADPERPLNMTGAGRFRLIAGEDVAWDVGAVPALDVVPNTDSRDSGYRERVQRDAADDLRLVPNGPVIFRRTPGRFSVVPSGPANSGIWHYRDDRSGYYLSVPAGVGAGGLVAFTDGQPLAARLRAAANVRPASIFTPEVQAITDVGTELAVSNDPPAPPVDPSHTQHGITFDRRAPYAGYNEELFLHASLRIASHFMREQRFEEAQDWLRCVFDPGTDDPSTDVTRYWQFLPFRAGPGAHVRELMEWLADPSVTRPEEAGFRNEIEVWRDRPFQPHAIARLRPGAYQWRTVFDWLDNLLEWGDQRFRRDTRESIGEATLLYALAGKLLGPPPQTVAPALQPPALSYSQLAGRWDEFSNAWFSFADHPLIRAWLAFLQWLAEHGTVGPGHDDHDETSVLTSLGLLYFCVPENERLSEYRAQVADRQYKIRHCQNIEGVARQLPLLEARIDPDLLVRATAAGLDLDEVLGERAVSTPQFRFPVLLERAHRLCGELKSLGASLLVALEKKDEQQLTLLRSRHEIELLDLVEAVREDQKREADVAADALRKSRDVVGGRYRQYQRLLGNPATREPAPGASVTEDASTLQPVPSGELGQSERGLGLVVSERDQLSRLSEAQIFAVIAGVSNTLAGASFFASMWPLFKDPGQSAGHAFNAIGSLFKTLSENASAWAARDALIAGYQRRKDDWISQSNGALRELTQIDRQIAGADIRACIADRELSNHREQAQRARDADEMMRGRYTSVELYDWLAGEVSAVYFSTYRLALGTARRAEQAMAFELGLQDPAFIRADAWTSRRRGLLAGERLSHDLHRMEQAYLDQRPRELEFTTEISLLRVAPAALVELKQTGSCDLSLPESLFDLFDWPGCYMRRIHSVALSVPAVAGSHVSVNCRLTLLSSSVRRRPDAGSEYARDRAGDERFSDDRGLTASIVTSGGVEDDGRWRAASDDGRLGVFEGRGAISTWRLELPDELRKFPYDGISDVVMRMEYTARDGGEELRDAAVAALQSALSSEARLPQARLISVHREYPTEWAQLMKGSTQPVQLPIADDRFPYLFRNQTIRITGVDVLVSPDEAAAAPALPTVAAPTGSLKLERGAEIGRLEHGVASGLNVVVPHLDPDDPDARPGANAMWKLSVPAPTAQTLRDILLLLTYRVTPRS